MTISGEIWRIVPSAPHIMASSEGRVMPTPRNEPAGRGYRAYGGIPSWGSWDRRQARFVVRIAGETYRVAKLVCEAFHGPKPFPEAICLHSDESASNNRASNLRWGTHAENSNEPGYLEYCRSRTGEANPRVKAKRKREADWLRMLRQVDMFDSSMEGADQ
jgi:hypothetical protein